VVIADHAGSGKTLAYLLPFIQGIQQEEALLGAGQATVPFCPRFLVICPTEELCAQVVMVCRALSKVWISSLFSISAMHLGRLMRSAAALAPDVPTSKLISRGPVFVAEHMGGLRCECQSEYVEACTPGMHRGSTEVELLCMRAHLSMCRAMLVLHSIEPVLGGLCHGAHVGTEHRLELESVSTQPSSGVPIVSFISS
jgi:hypothetical protein